MEKDELTRTPLNGFGSTIGGVESIVLSLTKGLKNGL
jgi:hypothetical protein